VISSAGEVGSGRRFALGTKVRGDVKLTMPINQMGSTLRSVYDEDSDRLPGDRFRFYLEQDYLFLIEYCRVFAFGRCQGARPAHDESVRGIAERHAKGRHAGAARYCKTPGLEEPALESAPVPPITHAYTRHLLTAAYAGTITDIVATVLLCQLGYMQIAAALAREGRGGNSFYAEWIAAYTSHEFTEGAQRLVELLDRSLKACLRAHLSTWKTCSSPATATSTVLGVVMDPRYVADLNIGGPAFVNDNVPYQGIRHHL